MMRRYLMHGSRKLSVHAPEREFTELLEAEDADEAYAKFVAAHSHDIDFKYLKWEYPP